VHIHLDTLAYSNRLRQLPPAQKLWFALWVLLLALVSHYPVQILIFGWMSVWIVIYAGIPRRVYGGMLVGVSVFLITSLPAIAIEYAGNGDSALQVDSLWQMNFGSGLIYLSYRGTIRALELLVRSWASTSVLFFIVLTIPAIDLVATCQKLGCPQILIELSLLIYRCIFMLADTAQTIVTAQISRGGYRTHRLRLNSLNLLVRQLIQRTVSRYRQLTFGINARGFNGEFRFWQPQDYVYSWRYAGESIGGGVLLLIGEVLYRIYV
jgi:cobalt/nickel transport system permease protein